MTRRGTTDFTGNLGSGVLILVKNGLTFSPLSTQHLFSLDPNSNCLAITVRIKKANLCTFLMFMSLLSAILFLTPVLNSFQPSSYHLFLLLTLSAILIAITHPGTFTAQRPLRKR